MAKYRNQLPQLSGDLFLTDSGLETVMIFHDEMELPEFAAFTLLQNDTGLSVLRKYYSQHAAIPSKGVSGMILESPTWRTSSDWGKKLGYTDKDLDKFNRQAIDLLHGIRSDVNHSNVIVISGCIGPKGDGYQAGSMMSVVEAEDYHQQQVDTFDTTEADMVSALTMTYAAEAIGITRAAKNKNLQVVISFTVETDGLLPSGQTLGDAIQEVDSATGDGPAYYMINCAHPTHLDSILSSEQPWINRLRGLRANASSMSHAELDEATQLDDGDPEQFGLQFLELRKRLPKLNVLGGCCGTDARHIRAIMERCAK